MPDETIADCKTCDDPSDSCVQPLPPGVEPGSEVTARGERWTVRAIVPHEDCTELHLWNARDAAGRVLLWPFDRPAAQIVVRRLRSGTLRRWWAHVASQFIAARVDGLSARAAAARVLPYQLVPALAVAQGTWRIVLADEVGLGKTVQAGWIISEILHRTRHARVLVAVPAGLRRQWESELRNLFAIDSLSADAAWLRRAYADLPADVDPWSLPGVYVASIDFVKRADVLRSIERQTWDALIVDEAHTAAAPTERHAALTRLAARARVLVLITATPFSGDAAAFASLMRLGTSRDEPPLMFRRAREDVAASHTRRHRFAPLRISSGERGLQRMLERYTREVWNTTDDDGARLAMTVLRKRALSSPEAVARSLDRRLRLLSGREPAPQQLGLFDEDAGIDDEEPLAALSAPGLADERRERRWLAQLAAAAHAAPDSKRRYLVQLLRRLGGEAAIVFTEYRDTLRHLAASFPGCLTLHGGMTAAERADVQARFNQRGGVLLATDAASEGLNLQCRCRLVICYELPWNPARLEQRIGRVDRLGQSRRVHAITLVARDTAEEFVLTRLARRLSRVAATLGERDRLAAFLTDARTAGIVIGGASAEPIDTTPLPITTGPAMTNAAVEEAGRLSTRRLGDIAVRDGCVRIASIGATSTLLPGFVFAFVCAAVTRDGRCVDAQPALLHVHVDEIERPQRARELRDLASGAIAQYERQALAMAASIASARLVEVRCVHEHVIDRSIARELELREGPPAMREIQPGLFDTRAVVRAQDDASLNERMRVAADLRIAALSHSRPLATRCDLVGVLIVHSRGRLGLIARHTAREAE